MDLETEASSVGQQLEPEKLEALERPGEDPTRQLEEELTTAVDEVDLRQALLSCFASRESYLWSVTELQVVLAGLGIRLSKAAINRLLGELSVELELSSWSPWMLVEGEKDWRLEPKSLLVSVLSGHRRITGALAKLMSQHHKAVLLVVLCYKARGGISRTHINRVLGLESLELLGDLKRWRVVFPASGRGYVCWLPTSAALLALGYRTLAEIPGLKELEAWIAGKENAGGEPGKSDARLERIFEKHDRWAGRRRERDKERRESVVQGYSPPPPQGEENLGFCSPIDEKSGLEAA
jgi:hypothetical protein